MLLRLVLYLFFLIVPCLITGNAIAKDYFDIYALAGKDEKEVSSIYGEPDACNHKKYGKHCSWNNANFEIVFIEGKADWITINNLESVFDDSILKVIGIKEYTPSFKSEYVMRWDNITDFKEISVFSGSNNKIDYIYVKVRTR